MSRRWRHCQLRISTILYSLQLHSSLDVHLFWTTAEVRGRTQSRIVLMIIIYFALYIIVIVVLYRNLLKRSDRVARRSCCRFNIHMRHPFTWADRTSSSARLKLYHGNHREQTCGTYVTFFINVLLFFCGCKRVNNFVFLTSGEAFDRSKVRTTDEHSS